MKIGIPVKEEKMDTNVNDTFGRAPYFLIFNLESEDSEFIVNEAASARGGAGIIAAQTVVDSGVEALLTPRMGKNAADIVMAAGIKMYTSVEGSVEENINLYKKGKLESLEDIHSGFHNHKE